MTDASRIIEMHDIDGMSFADIASALEKPRSTVSSIYYRTKAAGESVSKAAPDVKIHRKEDTNNLIISVEANPARIHTLDQLIEYCEVDLDTWVVARHIANKYATPRKEIYKDLTWDHGVVTGYVRDTGKMVQAGLIQIKAWFARRDPIPITPTIQPVKLDVPLEWAIAKERPTSGRSLVSSDWHIGFYRDLASGKLTPFHNRQALATFLDLAAAVKPDRIDLLGDLLDMPEWSDKFVRSPQMRQTTQPAILELAFWLTKLRALCPGIPIYVYEGNHGARLRRALMVHLPAAYQLKAVSSLTLPPALSIPNLLGLDALGIEWVGDYPAGCTYLGPIRLEHGDVVRQGAGDSAKKVVTDSQESSIFGHTHRLEKVHRTLYVGNRVRRVIFAASSGCLCSLEPGTVPGHTRRHNWQNGAVAVDYEKGSQALDPHLILFQNGIALWEGFSYKGEIPLEELKDTYPDWHF
jgi:hypothetical protein